MRNTALYISVLHFPLINASLALYSTLRFRNGHVYVKSISTHSCVEFKGFPVIGRDYPRFTNALDKILRNFLSTIG